MCDYGVRVGRVGDGDPGASGGGVGTERWHRRAACGGGAGGFSFFSFLTTCAVAGPTQSGRSLIAQVHSRVLILAVG